MKQVKLGTTFLGHKEFNFDLIFLALRTLQLLD